MAKKAGSKPAVRPEKLEQRLRALGQANRIRGERAAIKASLRAGELRAASLLQEPPDALQSASIAEVLLAIPGIGEVKVRRLLQSCGLPPRRTLSGLSERQRSTLIRALGSRG